MTIASDETFSIAYAWLTGWGLNDRGTIDGWLDTIAPETLAAECLAGWWGGDAPDAPDLEELTAAFVTLAASREWLEDD